MIWACFTDTEARHFAFAELTMNTSANQSTRVKCESVFGTAVVWSRSGIKTRQGSPENQTIYIRMAEKEQVQVVLVKLKWEYYGVF